MILSRNLFPVAAREKNSTGITVWQTLVRPRTGGTFCVFMSPKYVYFHGIQWIIWYIELSIMNYELF